MLYSSHSLLAVDYFIKEGNQLETDNQIFDVAANMIKGFESIGGRLTITEKEVIFKSHKLNIQKGTVTIAMSDILDVGKRNTLFLVPNGLKIGVKSGEEYKFVVNQRTKLINYLNDQIGKSI